MRSTACILVASLAPLAAHAAETGDALSSSGMVLVGPRMIAVGDEAVVIWIEEPKTLVAVLLDAHAQERQRREIDLAAKESPVVQITPMLLEGDGPDPFDRLAVALLERDVERLGEHARLSRITVHRFGEVRDVDLVAEGPGDGAGGAPTAIVGAGAHTAARLPAVVWRKSVADRGGHERRAASSTLTVLRAVRAATGDLLGESRFATAVAWGRDGSLVVAASDAGRPLVVTAVSEHVVDVPTPATLSALVLPERDPTEWVAAGLDGCRRLFVVAAAVRASSTRSFFLPLAPLVESPPDLADAGVALGLPLLVRRPAGVSLIWPARVGASDELRMRELTDLGAAAAPSVSLISCPAGARLLAADAVSLEGGVVAAVSCAKMGRADVRTLAVGVRP